MTLEKRLMAFLAIILIIPMVLLTVIATKTGKEEQQKVLTNTLQSGLKVVRGEMLERKNGMRRVCSYFADSEGAQKAVLNKDWPYLHNRLTGLKRYFEYVDYALVVDGNNEAVAELYPSMRYVQDSRLGQLVQKALTKKQVIFSEERFPLDILFVPHSSDYDKFVVKGKSLTLKEALTSVAIMPIYQGHDTDKVIGAIVVADLFNNDLAFPNYVGTYSKDAIVLAGMDGIRIAANYAPGGENLLGTDMPPRQYFESQKQDDKQQYSSLKINGEPYIMVRENILNNNKEPIGSIGLGLPAKNYYTWAAASNYFVLFVLALYGLLLVAARHYLEENITQPFTALSDRSQLYLRERYPQEEQPVATEESEVLTRNFAVLTDRLETVEKDREIYCKKFKEEFNRQTYLANELRYLNGHLERQVEERTQHLGTMVEELQRANEVKTKFLANLSHELRTPLNIIMSSAEVLEDEILGPLTPKQKNYAQGIYSSGSHLLSLINNLLSLSKLEFGKQKLCLSDFYLKPLVEEVVRNVRKFDCKKTLNITVTFAQKDILLNADAQKIRQIIYNLMSNAVKFTPSGGSINVQARRKGNMLQLVIEDNGVGIAKEDLGKVFQEFEQVGGAPSSKYDGTGLGLPLVKLLTELHGGTVSLESDRGQGCKVTVFLPLNTQNFLQARQNEEGAINGNNFGG